MTLLEAFGADVFRWSGPNRGLMLGVWWNVLLLAASVAAMPFDQRRILGLNPWIKPVKFELSVILFLLTFCVLLAGLGRMGALATLRGVLGWGIGLALAAENSLIALQSLRGVRSHMNYTSALNAGVFAAMGLLIGLVSVLVAVVLVAYLTVQTGLPAPLTWGICLGLVALLAGSAEGVLMVAKYTAHTVGAADGGPGLAFLNWSTRHGDLRVAHFFAIHALQAFVLAGWLASRMRGQWLGIAAVVLFAALYTAGTWMLFRQAVRGEPVLAARSQHPRAFNPAKRSGG